MFSARESGPLTIALAGLLVTLAPSTVRSQDVFKAPTPNGPSAAALPGTALPTEMGPQLPPPRLALVDEGNRLVAGIVAQVDNQAILLSDVVGPVRGRLMQAKEQLSHEDYLKVEWELLRQVTEHKVQRIVVLRELAARLPNPAVMPRIRASTAKQFDHYLLKLARDAGLDSREAIIEKLKSEGSDLDELRRDFVDNQLSQQFLYEMVKTQTRQPTKMDLETYYQEHIKEYEEDAGAIWRHIEVKFGSDENAARDRITRIHRQLKAGADFEELASKDNDSPMAINGGLWSLTSSGSYADDAVDKVLFSIPVNQISPVIRGQSSFHIVRVEKRSDGGSKPFVEVQDEIRRLLENESLTKLREEKIEELMTKHYVETIFDEPDKPSVSDTRLR